MLLASLAKKLKRLSKNLGKSESKTFFVRALLLCESSLILLHQVEKCPIQLQQLPAVHMFQNFEQGSSREMAFSDVTDCKEKRFGEAQKEGKVVGLIVWSFSIGFNDNYRVSIKNWDILDQLRERSEQKFILRFRSESVIRW